ncbi:hypothetical protein ACCT07_34495 [Rhizobium johnstonii]|uniref:hypothetical protein n=1 Tax=Rhizobium johnstonii TaxID=3019933 RepID=UPI003F968C45
MSNRQRITIRIDRHDHEKVKVVWEDARGLPFLPYHVYAEWIQQKVQVALAALDELNNAYRQTRPDFEPAIEKLAVAGDELRKALFDDTLDHQLAHQPEAWFNRLAGSTTDEFDITVHADPSLPIPWGLLHNGSLSPRSDIWPAAGFIDIELRCSS